MRSGSDPLQRPEPLVRSVYSYVAYRLGEGPDAEDATNEVFERALRYRKSYDQRQGEPVEWLTGIARRVVAEHRARLAGRPLGQVVEVASSQDLEEETVRRMTLTRLISTLSERDQELISLRYGADLTARQIAAVLEADPHAIEVALHRALGRLRARLESDDVVASAG